jgi:glycerol-3-phosphate dehydrogenase
MADFDLAIIGGGINGAGIARDAAGRGLKVVLIEQNDLAFGTSSASSKLIHGGLRYLEHGALRLVRAAPGEREVLLRRRRTSTSRSVFVLPLDPVGRSPLVLRLGLLDYDLLGRREILPGTGTLDLVTDAAGQPLKCRSTTPMNIRTASPTMRASSCLMRSTPPNEGRQSVPVRAASAPSVPTSGT